MKLKKVLGLTLILGSLFSTVAFAKSTTPIHGAEVNRCGLYAAGFAHTEWDKAHCTKMTIGWSSDIASGVYYSQTDVVDGYGSSSSGYWQT